MIQYEERQKMRKRERRGPVFFVICEDEAAFAEQLKKDLDEILSAKKVEYHVRHCSSGSELSEVLGGDEPVDLLFMDIQLGQEDGVELVRKLNHDHVRIPTIFLTSLEDRIADGYDVSALNFLFKRDYRRKLPELMERFLNEVYQSKTLLINHHDSTVMLHLDEIYYAEPENRTTLIHTAVSCYQEKNSIQNFAKLLPAELFIEAYHSLYINVDHIRKLDSDSVVMDNDKELPVSRRKRKELMTAVMRRIRTK